MGEVFLANDTHLNRFVALKVLSESVAADNERLERFEQEAKAASALNHPNILTIFEFGEEDGIQFIVTEFIKGETLRERLQRGSLTVAEVLDFTIQIASALHSAHSAYIIHRDIKPENVMIREDGYVKVLDFGLAKPVLDSPLGAEAETLRKPQTHAGMIMGTVAYMSPEQARGKPVDQRTDLFSLGVVLYEMLTNRQPFTGETINHVIVAILEKKPPPLSTYIDDYPPELEEIIQKCLAKNVGDRYQTAKDLLDDLKAIKQDVDFHSGQEAHKIHSGNGTEGETEIFNRPTERTVNAATGAVSDAEVSGNPLIRLTSRAKHAFASHGRISLFLTLMAAGFLYFLLINSSPDPPDKEAVRLFNSGVDALRDGTYFKASKMFEDAIRIDGGFREARAGLAESWMELDYLGRAQAEMLKVNEIRNKSQSIYTSLYKTDDSLYIDAINAAVVRNFPEAVRIYNRIAENSPHEPHVYLDLGRAYERTEEIDKAIVCYEKAINLDKQYGAAFLRLGILLRRKAQYDKSGEAFDKAENIYERLSNDEGVAEVRYQRGVSLNLQDKLGEARAQFEHVLNNPRANKHQQIRSLMQISSICSSMSETPCAEDYASRAVALAKQERMENLASSGLIDLGNAYLAGREYEKAERNFLLAIDFSRQDGGARNDARALLAMGSLRIQQKRPDEAEDFVRQSLPFFEQGGYQKEIVQANLILGRACEQKENFDLAVRAYTNVVGSEAASPADRAYAEMVIGNVLMKKEDYGAALRHAERGSDLYRSLNNPYYAAYSLFSHIEILSQLGRFEDAGSRLSEVREIVRKSPGYQKQLLPRIQLLSAQIALRERNFAEAVKEAARALESTDPYVQSEANKVLSLAQSYLNPRGKDAVEICQRALRAASDTRDQRAVNDAKLTLSEIFLVTGSPGEALEIVLPLKDHFESAGQLESAWRALQIAGQASRRTGSAENAKAFSAAALRIFGQLPGKLGEEHINSYRARPDIGFYYKEAEKLTGF